MTNLPERWIILWMDKNSGKLRLPRSVFECGITGAMMLELAFAKRIGLTDGKKIKALDNAPMDDPLLTKALGLIAKAKKTKTVTTWMIQMTMQNSQVIESFYFKQMVNQGILKKESKKVLSIFNSSRYYLVSRDSTDEIHESLANMIQMKTPKEKRSLFLLGLVSRCGYADNILGTELSSLLSQNSTRIFSSPIGKTFSPEFVPFFNAVLDALTNSQKSAGEF